MMCWRTLSQRIRTASETAFEAILLETTDPPIYQRIASEADRFHRLGLNTKRIAHSLGVADKTVAKALAWWARRGG